MQARRPKILNLALTAVKNLKEVNGASPWDICNYISSTYNIPRDVAKRHTLLALKRGTAHGILKESGGCYSLLTDIEKECVELTNQELGLLDLACRKRRMMQRKRKAMKKVGKVKKKERSRKSSKGRSGINNSRKREKSRSKRSKSRKMNGRSKSKSRGNKMRSCTCPPSRREGHRHRSSSRKKQRDQKIKKSSRSRKRSKSERKHRKSESRARKKEKREKREKSSKKREKKGRRYCDCPPSVRGRPEGSMTEGNVNKKTQKNKHKKEAKKDVNEQVDVQKNNYFYELFKLNFGNRNKNKSPKLTVTNN